MRNCRALCCLLIFTLRAPVLSSPVVATLTQYACRAGDKRSLTPHVVPFLPSETSRRNRSMNAIARVRFGHVQLAFATRVFDNSIGLLTNPRYYV